MNALARNEDFMPRPALRSVPERQWIVLRCASSKTIALARLLSDHDSEHANRYPDLGAWTPVWKRQKRRPRSNERRLVDLPAIPSFVFVPAEHLFNLPTVPGIAFSPMRIDGVLVRIADRELATLRKIDMQPRDPVKNLPKIGAVMRFIDGPFQGLHCRVVYATQRFARVTVDGFAQPLQVPPSILREVD